MTESTPDAVLHRLVSVERAMRQWQVVGSLAMALLALVVEGLMELVQRRLDPIRRRIGDGSRQMPDAVDAVTGS